MLASYLAYGLHNVILSLMLEASERDTGLHNIILYLMLAI